VLQFLLTSFSQDSIFVVSLPCTLYYPAAGMVIRF